MSPAYRNVLLVEGDKDRFVIPELIEQNGYPWGDRRAPLVWIEQYGGDKSLLRRGVLETELKRSGLHALGIVLDADASAASRWEAVRAWAKEALGDRLPEELPAEGCVIETEEGIRFGAWLMPDNRSAGMMETFLAWLCPEDAPHILSHAHAARDEAHRLGAPFKQAHFDKALIHTWLAWQDEPGNQLHQAVKYRILRADSPASQPFVTWFSRLYQLAPKATSNDGRVTQ